MWGKHGLSAPTTPTMPCQRGAENYSSHEAAHRDPPTPRGLQSHVQASLVNSARARVASELVAAKVSRSAGIPAGRAGPLGPAHTRTLTRTRPRPHSSPAPCKNAHHPAPRPPPRPESRRGCIVASPARPRALRPLRPPRRGTPKERGKRERKEAAAGGGRRKRGGKPPAPSMAGTAAEPRGSVCNLKTSRLASLQRTKVTGAAQGPHVPREEGPQTARAQRAGLQPPQRLRKASGVGGAGHACVHARPSGRAGRGLQS